MHISHSQLESWRSCQFKWALDKVFDAPRAPGSSFIVGRALHKAIETDGLRKLDGQPDLALEYLTQVATFHMGEELDRDDPDGRLASDVREIMYQRVTTMVRAYVEHVRPIYKPVAAPEEPFDLDIGDGVRIRGVIDARTAGGYLDWKTATHPWLDAREHIDQAICYTLVHPEVSTLTYVVFACDPEKPDTCVVNKFKVGVSEAQKQDYIARMHRAVQAMRDAEAEGVYYAQPQSNCAWCSYLGSCTIGQNWLYQKHIPVKVPVVEHRAHNACPCCGGQARVQMYGRVTELMKRGTQYISECDDCLARYSVTRWDKSGNVEDITIDWVKTAEQVRQEREHAHA